MPRISPSIQAGMRTDSHVRRACSEVQMQKRPVYAHPCLGYHITFDGENDYT